MGTTLTYNSVTLVNVLTRSFEEECVYDESGTDLLYHKFTLRVMGYIHSNSPSTSRVGASTNAANKHICTSQINLRTALMEPRKNLVLTVGGAVLLQVDPNNGRTAPPWGDVNNGPKPKNCRIVHIAGSGMFRVEFEIELAVVECADNKNSTGILNNRWSMADEIDEHYTTRRITGRLRLVDITLNPQAFRSVVVPPLQRGFKRQTISVTTTPDGLSLDYTVIDVERYAAPPFPGIAWDGTHTVSTGDGVNTHVEMVIRLTGDKNTDKRTLIETCALVCFSKLDFQASTHVLENAAVIDHLQECVVEMRVAVLQVPIEPLENYGFNTLKLGTILDTPADYDRDVWPVPKEYGTATTTGLFVSFLQSPCDEKHSVPRTTDKPPKKGDAGRGDDTEIFTFEGNLPIDQPAAASYSDDHKQFPYTHYEIDSNFKTNTMKLQLPIAAPSGQADQDASAFIKMALPQTKRVVRVSAERYGAWPKMPVAAEAVDLGNGVTAHLLDWSTNPKAPGVTANGLTPLYSNDAEYVYGLSRPVSSLENLPTGALPWGTKSLSQTSMPKSTFESGVA